MRGGAFSTTSTNKITPLLFSVWHLSIPRIPWFWFRRAVEIKQKLKIMSAKGLVVKIKVSSDNTQKFVWKEYTFNYPTGIYQHNKSWKYSFCADHTNRFHRIILPDRLFVIFKISQRFKKNFKKSLFIARIWTFDVKV